MQDFAALLTNEQLLWEYPHTIFAAIATGAFRCMNELAAKIHKAESIVPIATSHIQTKWTVLDSLSQPELVGLFPFCR
jgi:cytochrome bd-type quinol oxidase subunit 1